MIYNSLDCNYKSIIGAVNENEELTISVKGEFDSLSLLVRKDGSTTPRVLPMVKDGAYFRVTFTMPSGLYFYMFSLGDGKYIGKNSQFCGVITRCPEEFQLTFYDKNYSVPSWLNGGIIYQIFPDRFCRAIKEKQADDNKILRDDWGGIPIFKPDKKGEILNNDFFGGDFKGIISKLDYLSSLGVTAIYLNPIFKAYSNHRYDTGNYMEIDPLLGTEEDFKQLISSADIKGIKIILDGVFNHTGDDSIYFNKKGNYPSLGAYQSKNSPYYSWFKFIDYPHVYESWWGIKTLPATDKTNTDYINYISGKDGVIEHYTKMGIGGWRLDVVDELPSAFVKEIRKASKGINKQSIIIGEVWENASNKVSYGERREYFQGKELDSVMNYPLKNAIIDFVKYHDADKLVYTIREQVDNYPKEVLHSLMNILSTHDTYRLLSAVADVNVNGKTKNELANMLLESDELNKAVNLLKVSSLLQYTLCGVPTIYYGDEVGMQGYTDPLNRRCFPWGAENLDVLDWYKKIGNIRKEYSCFKQGDISIIYYCDGVIIFKRKDDCSELLVAINLSNSDILLEYEGQLIDLLSNLIYKDLIELGSNSFMILKNVINVD
ncbi:MAG: glycoside hydrolase family 13 protein [Clostridia bacterium]|nr:glycoside hydrolase family 13 protein [Clostridia bacterium]